MYFSSRLYITTLALSLITSDVALSGNTSLQTGGSYGTSAPASSIIPLLDVGIRVASKWLDYPSSGSGSGSGAESDAGSGSNYSGEGEVDRESISMPKSVYIPEGMSREKIIEGLRHPNDDSDDGDSANRALNTLDSLKLKQSTQGNQKQAIAKRLNQQIGPRFKTNDLKYYTDSFSASIQNSKLISKGYKHFLTINPKRSLPKQEWVHVPKCSINPNPRGPGYPEGICPVDMDCTVVEKGNMVFVYKNKEGQLKVSVIQDHVNTKAACVRTGKSGKRKGRR